MIEVRAQKQLGEFRLDAAFEAPAGVTALFGRSGAGKTSLANAVAGLLRPEAGRIAVDGTVLFDSARRIDLPVRHRRIGYVFQDARLFPHRTVARNLSYGGRHDAARVIEMLGLGPLLDRYPAALSGGEASRVALGRALMSDPVMLILDEPLSALDAPRKAEILPYLERLRDTVRLPILYVSHSASEVARLATTLVIMEAGRVLRVGPAEEVMADPAAVPLLGVQEAGSLITARVEAYDAEDDLTELALSAGRLLLPGRAGVPGQPLRLRIAAQDVILSLEEPSGLSALTRLPVTVTRVEEGRGPGVAVGLAAGTDRLLARLTRRSARSMGLAPGQQVWAIVKATAVAPQDVGG
ncbi:molybdenum ABC transporter ATP-binding protein [Pseudoroseicyclus aestuarii]|uniref:Molybdate transport system ATP-binding protein n=1 Tax=Pseudoroseicyclus aestuarii TaxID=1795041 RepID=A0A318T3N1_9RHOB|nr:molybdenum ABC transporter ATP-binding protein [Pseudoroseicyclus aestuarii]PYE80911.1 molybdate transport system ATP-binding protein [Pseudoroseicyclus aestuarii]